MDNQVIQVLLCLAEDVSTPRALTVAILCRSGEWAQLQKLSVRPIDYLDAESYFKDCLVTDFLRKCQLPTDRLRLEKEARATFIACEQQCCATNARLSRFLPEHLYLEDGEMPVYDFINRWRKEVSYVFGNPPATLTPRFSGGSTYADVGKLITIPDKMSSIPTLYPHSLSLLPSWAETSWARSLRERLPSLNRVSAVRSNIFFTVDKSAIARRGCCKEASLAVSYQLDIGRHLKNRARTTLGIDLRHGQKVHQELAQLASVTDDYATIDMSNASDTVSRVLVQLIVRSDWYELLDSLRARFTEMNGRVYRLEKFSSMGNGFTFELESILFATLARQVVSDEGGDPNLVRCYGDDLIVPTAHSRSVLAALRLFGFTPNVKKTFTEGPFRESCGGDFFDGVPVRAHFLKELPDEPQHWIRLANGLRRVSGPSSGLPHRWAYTRRAWNLCLRQLPGHIRRCRGPEWLGDAVIHDHAETWGYYKGHWAGQPLTEPAARSGWDQQWIVAYVPIPTRLSWAHWDPTVQLASCTLGLPSDGVTPRGGVSGYRVQPVPIVGIDWVPSNTRG